MKTMEDVRAWMKEQADLNGLAISEQAVNDIVNFCLRTKPNHPDDVKQWRFVVGIAKAEVTLNNSAGILALVRHRWRSAMVDLWEAINTQPK